MHTGLANLGLSASPNGLSPVLDLQFLSDAGVDGRITYSGGAGGTYTDSTGVIRPQRGNLALWSQRLANVIWNGSNTIGAEGTVAAPDGSLTGNTITITGAGFFVQQVAVTPGASYVLSFSAMAGTSPTVNYFVWDVTHSAGIIGPINYVPSINANGWTRINVPFTAPAGCTSVYIDLSRSSASGTVFAWGVQLEPGSIVTPYIPTTSAAVFAPRIDFDPVTHAPKGVLVEEQRTNLLLNSANLSAASWTATFGGVAVAPTVTANFAAAPDGSNAATRLQFNVAAGTTSSDISYITQAVTAFNNGTGSFYLRTNDASTNTLVVRVGATQFTTVTVTPQWQRFTVNDPTAGTDVDRVQLILYGNTGGGATRDILVWGAQLEAGSFATSYIPTTNAAVTRTADAASVAGANFSSWFNTAQGTFIAEFDTVAAAMTASRGVIGSGASARYVFVPGGGSTAVSYDGVLSINSVASVADGLPHKVASSYATGRLLDLDGAAVVSGTQAAAYTQGSSLFIGDFNGLAPLNGHIRRIRYWSSQLANTQLQVLTT